MKTTLILFICLFAYVSQAQQVLFEEHFDVWDFPPTDWTVKSDGFTDTHWASTYSDKAGGSPYEARIDWYPGSDKGLDRLISPEIDLTGNSTVTLSFKQKVEYKENSFEIGVATRSNGGAWNVVWSKVITESINAEEKIINITNADVNSSTFQFSIYFDGSFGDIKDWLLDDVIITAPPADDVSPRAILGNRQFISGDSYIPTASIQNVGKNSQTFKSSATITDFDTDLVLYSDTVELTLAAGEAKSALFPGYTIPENSKVYKLVVETHLEGDENISNNSLHKHINTYTLERQYVLLEIGTGTWCSACPSSAVGADDLIAKGHDVAIIEHHSSDDYTVPDSRARIDYLGITGFPTAFFDAHYIKSSSCSSGSCYTEYLELYEVAKGIKSPITIALTKTETKTGVFNINVKVEKSEAVTESSLKLRVALTESHIAEAWPSGFAPENQLKHVNFVNHGFYPNAEGTTIDILNNTSVEHDFEIDANKYKVDNCEVVVFIESDVDKYVYQTSKISLSSGMSINKNTADAEISIFPNPSIGTFKIENTLGAKLIIFDMLGSVIYINEQCNSNSERIEGLSQGSYIIKATKGNQQMVRKIIVVE